MGARYRGPVGGADGVPVEFGYLGFPFGGLPGLGSGRFLGPDPESWLRRAREVKAANPNIGPPTDQLGVFFPVWV